MKMKLSAYHRKLGRPGVLFSERETCGALGIEVLSGRGRTSIDGRAALVLAVSGRTEFFGNRLSAGDLLYWPAGIIGAPDYAVGGRALLVRFAPASHGPEIVSAPMVIPAGAAFGYVRTQYCGAAHGWGRAAAGFNPAGVRYLDKLWGTSRDVLCQELAMPPGHVVPVHAHGRLGAKPDGRDFWQAYYVWEGSARVDIGRSPRETTTLRISRGSVLIYPNGVAHNVIAGPRGCRYIFFEKRAEDHPRTMDLDAEKDYERKLVRWPTSSRRTHETRLHHPGLSQLDP
jgi:mannose-6-phosphate isomerase-like protein (cupin superfamily)